jgi:uncharacterized iron-regulated membrane protein
MNPLTEHIVLISCGLIIFILVGVVAFFKRNNQAKTDRNPQPQERPNESGVAPIVKTKKQ